MKKIYFFMVLFVVKGAWGQTTYTWNQTGTASWATSTNWTPTRTTPATTDILQFNNGATTTATNVPTQTIGGLLVTAGTKITLNTSTGAATLTIAANQVVGADLSVDAACQLNVAITGGAFPLTITVATTSTGSISGAMDFSSATATTANTITAADASGITFNSGSTFTQNTNNTGNVFGSGTSNSIVFASGSTFIQNAGANPFQKAAPASVVVFQTGSLFKFQQNAAPSFSGRTYANLEINFASYSQTSTGTGALSIDNLIITAGAANINLTVGGISIKGNISVASSQTLVFNPLAANTLTFNGASSQSISNAGTLTFAANAAVVIANSSGVTFNNNQTISGTMTVNASALLATSATLTLTGSPAINGSFQLNQGGSEAGGTMTYGASSTLIYAGTSTQTANAAEFPSASSPNNLTSNNSVGVTFPGAFVRTIPGNLNLLSGVLNDGGNIITVGSNITGTGTHNGAGKISMTGSGKTISGAILQNLELNNAGGFSLSGSATVNGTLILTSGTLTAGPNTLTVAGGLTSTTGNIDASNASATVAFTNSSALILPSGTFSGIVTNFTMNGSGGVTLSSGMIVGGNLTLTNGIINTTGANPLSYFGTGAGGGGSPTSHVNGPMVKQGITDYQFPIGNATLYRPISVSGLSGPATITASYTQGNPQTTFGTALAAGIDHIGVCEYWELGGGGGVTGITGLQFGGSCNANPYVNDPASLLVAHWNGSQWDNLGNDGSATSTTVKALTASTFSPFTIGSSSSSNPLPILLLNFSGYKDGSRNQLRWTTNSEQSNSGFEVQRSSDGINYTAIGFVNSQAIGGNSTTQLSYAFADNNVIGSKQYYRLRQVNFDGISKLSNIVLIKGNKPTTLTIDGLFPNPASTSVNVLIATPNKDKITMVVTDIAGRTVIRQSVNVETGSNTIPVDISRLTNGTYMVKLVCSSDCEMAVGKFVKN